jgi:hypothetical protein
MSFSFDYKVAHEQFLAMVRTMVIKDLVILKCPTIESPQTQDVVLSLASRFKNFHVLKPYTTNLTTPSCYIVFSKPQKVFSPSEIID